MTVQKHPDSSINDEKRLITISQVQLRRHAGGRLWPVMITNKVHSGQLRQDFTPFALHFGHVQGRLTTTIHQTGMKQQQS